MTQAHVMLNPVFLDNTLTTWLLAGAAFCFTFLVLPLVRGRIRAQQTRWRDMENPALELLALLVSRTSRLVLLIIGLTLAEKILTLPPKVDRVFEIVIICSIWFQAAIWVAAALRFFIQRRQRRAGFDDVASKSSVDVLMFVAQLVIWAVFILLALDNLGVNITALVAGMGVGGIAIALAVQTILGDLFASLSITFDKPFVVGDMLQIDDIEGSVEHIGIKSTRLRSVSGEQIVLANADVLKSRLRNLGRMAEKRVKFRINVAYDTPHEQVAHVASLVEEVVKKQPGTRFVSCLLAHLGEYAQEFEVIYFVQSSADLPRINDGVNRGIVERFAAQGIGFAYPTRRNV
jgi:small-conductance mechanosensitive channel